VKSERRTPERTCIMTRRPGAPESMIRFVRAPDGAVTPDIKARLPGRGVWVTARAPIVAEAARKQAFSHSLKAKALAAPTLAEDVDALLESDCLQILGLANKAGALVAGFGKVAEALEKGEIGVLIEARDGSPEGRRKLAQAARRGAALTGTAPKWAPLFTSSQLDLALGRTNVIHAAVKSGGFATAVWARCARLSLYRGESGRDEQGDAHIGGAPMQEDMNFSPDGREDQRS